MVQIVTAYCFHDGSKGHDAALRMLGRDVEIVRRERLEQCLVPGLQSDETRKRCGCIERSVAPGPEFLIEGLNHVVRLRERLAQSETKGDLAICEVADDLAGRPLTR